MKKKTFIVSTYNHYEWVNTEDSYSKILLMIKYHKKGYRVWDWPLWVASIIWKLFKKPILKGRTAEFERLIPGSDQITYHTPYHNY